MRRISTWTKRVWFYLSNIRFDFLSKWYRRNGKICFTYRVCCKSL